MMTNLLKKRRTVPLVTRFSQQSEIAEQYRVIRTRIVFEMTNHEVKTLLITSAITGEGKSTVAANLATVLADGGFKVLLVDADLRTGGLTNGLQVDNQKGLSNTLNQAKSNPIVTQNLNDSQLHFLSSGPILDNATELFHSDRIKRLTDQLKTQYDIIIFDAPAICEVADAQILARNLDGTLLVVNERIVSEKDVKQARDMIEIVHGNLIGAINNFSYH